MSEAIWSLVQLFVIVAALWAAVSFFDNRSQIMHDCDTFGKVELGGSVYRCEKVEK
jgi:hypothetical protein